MHIIDGQPTQAHWRLHEKVAKSLRDHFREMRNLSSDAIDLKRQECYAILEKNKMLLHRRHFVGFEAEIDYIWCLLRHKPSTPIQPTHDGPKSMGDFFDPSKEKGGYIDVTTNLTHNKINQALCDSEYKCYAVRKRGIDWQKEPCGFVIYEAQDINALVTLYRDVSKLLKKFGHHFNPIDLMWDDVENGIKECDEWILDIENTEYNEKIPHVGGFAKKSISKLKNKKKYLMDKREHMQRVINMENRERFSRILSLNLELEEIVGHELKSDWEFNSELVEKLDEFTPKYLELIGLLGHCKDIEGLPEAVDEILDELLYENDINSKIEDFLFNQLHQLIEWDIDITSLIEGYGIEVLDFEQIEIVYLAEEDKTHLGGTTGSMVYEFRVHRAIALILNHEVVEISSWKKEETIDLDWNIHWYNDEMEDCESQETSRKGLFDDFFRYDWTTKSDYSKEVEVLGYVLNEAFGTDEELTDEYLNPNFTLGNIDVPDVH
tara:strand:- start:55 stop:1530 length:1476 start_codon:yes stop_codon:yes gene_type:complete